MNRTREEIQIEFNDLTAENDHAGAAALLVEELGEKKDVFIISRVNEIHKKLGYLPHQLDSFRSQYLQSFYEKFNKLK